MAHRFYVPPDSISGEQIVFSSDQRNQMRNVLRLRPEDHVTAFDGSGREYDVHLLSLDQTATGAVIATTIPETESAVHITLIQALPKGEKLDLILQKCTEVGVAEFIMVETERTIAKVPREKLASRLARWRSIVTEATEQSGRVVPPIVDGVLTLKDAIRRVASSHRLLIAWESEDRRTLCPELVSTERIALLVGPEGGLSVTEVGMAESEGGIPFSLGPRILRAETAAIVGSAMVLREAERCRADGALGGSRG